MPIPKFNEFFKPFLLTLIDGETHSFKDIREKIAAEFKLTDEEVAELLPSGLQTVFYNRVQWAGTYLNRAGLVLKPARATYLISEEGKKVAKDDVLIDVNFLNRYETFRRFHETRVEGINNSTQDIDTPDYAFEESFKQIQDNLADEILNEVMKLSPKAFEQMVIDVLRKMGYGAFEDSGRATSYTNDEGIDGVIMEDKLGFNLIYIQAKQWDLDTTVGRPEIQNFVGAISGKGGNGLFVTTARYSKPAIEYAKHRHIILIDGKRLAELMIEYDFGVTVKHVFQIKEIDTDVFNSYIE